jgi:hypothetical protein
MTRNQIDFSSSSEELPVEDPMLASTKRKRNDHSEDDDSSFLEIIQQPKRSRTRKSNPPERISTTFLQSRGERVHGAIDFDEEQDKCLNCNTPIGNIVGTEVLYCEHCLEIPEIKELWDLSKKQERNSLSNETYDDEDSFIATDDEPILYEDGTQSDEDSDDEESDSDDETSDEED